MFPSEQSEVTDEFLYYNGIKKSLNAKRRWMFTQQWWCFRTRGESRSSVSRPRSAAAVATCSMFSLQVLFRVTDRDLSQIGLYRHLEILLQQIPRCAIGNEITMATASQHALPLFLPFPPRTPLFILVNDSVTQTPQLLGGGSRLNGRRSKNTLPIVLRAWYS